MQVRGYLSIRKDIGLGWLRPLTGNSRPFAEENGDPTDFGTGVWSVAGPGPACFPADTQSRFSSLGLFVGRTRGAGKVLRLDFLDVELRHTFAHCLQNIFERRGLAFDPAQWVDARHNEGT
jgi:hypothetical protein